MTEKDAGYGATDVTVTDPEGLEAYHVPLPSVNIPITEGGGEIAGDSVRDEGRDLATVPRRGAMPAELEPQPRVEAY